MSRAFLCVVALSLIATACSSTTREDGLKVAGPGGLLDQRVGDPNESPGSPGSPGDANEAPGEESTDVTASVSDPQPGGGQETRSAPEATTEAPSSPAFRPSVDRIPSSHRAVSESTIHIGVTFPADYGSAAEAFGFEGVSSYTKAEATALVKAITDRVNAAGGVGGRQLSASVEMVNVLSGTWDSQAQAVCERFTSDQPAFAVITFHNVGSSVLPACLAAAGSVHIESGNSSPYDQKSVESFRWSWYDPHRLELDRFGSVVDSWVEQAYFGPKARVGLIRLDEPNHERTEMNVIRPALARHGIALTDTYAFQPPESAAALSSTANEANSAVLRFNTNRIDHVIFLYSLSALPFLFMPAAESQGYRPKYGLTSADIPAFLDANVPASQLEGSVVVGWSRIADLAQNQRFDDSEQMRRCVETIRPTGFTYPGVGHSVICDPFFFLQSAVNAASEISDAGFRAAVDRLGTTFQLADAPATTFGPRRTGGPSAVRHMRFDSKCSCFGYTSDPRPLN